MTGIAYLATGPSGTRFASVHLRIHAQQLRNHPVQDQLKTVFQVVENGTPIVESPVHVEFMQPLELCAFLSQSVRDGWDVEQAA